MKPVLLLDVGMQRGALGRLEANRDFANKGVLKVAGKAGLKLERFLLVEGPNLSDKEAKKMVEGRRGVILGGSGMVHPTDEREKLGFKFLKGRISSGMINTTALRIITECCKQGVPLLGICYGHQMITRFAGEEIVELPEHEFGFVSIKITDDGRQDALFAGLPGEMRVAEYHSLGVVNPKNVEVLALNGACAQAIKLPGHKIYGVQFHPDFYQDVDGKGTGALQHYYTTDKLWKVLGERTGIEPRDNASAYSLNNVPLLNFIRMCGKHV